MDDCRGFGMDKAVFTNKGIENPRLDAEILLCAVLKCERINLYVRFDQPLEDEELALYRGYVARPRQSGAAGVYPGQEGFYEAQL